MGLRIFMTLIFAVGLGMFTMHIYYTQLGEKEVPKSLNTSEIETILLHIRDQSDRIRRLEQKVDDLEKLIKEKRTRGGINFIRQVQFEQAEPPPKSWRPREV